MRRCHDRVLYLVLFGVVACGCNTPRGVQSPVLPPAPVGAKSPRAGSTLASETKPTSPPAEKTTVEQPAADAKPTGDDTSIASLMRDLDKAGKLDDATKARLLADLKKTPREQWPMIINVLRASLEYEKPETQPDVTPPPAEVATEVPTQPVDDFVVIEPSREASPLLTESEPAKAANPVRTPEIDKQPDPKQVARPDEDALALSQRNMLRANDASGNDPLASQNPIRGRGYPGTDQPPLDPPTSASSEKVKLVSAETDSPLRAPSALPQTPGYAKPTSWNAALEETIAMLEENSGDHDPATQAKLRLLYLAAGRRSDANQEVPGVSEDAKAYWSEQVYALGLYLDDETTPNSRQRATRAAHHARGAAYRLGQLGNLIVRNMAMATAVYSYGVYDELGEYRVASGQEVILYAELENFTSEETAKGYHTSLKANYEIIDRRGARVARETLGDSEEHCRNLRRDFFVAYSVVIPRDLHAGEEYTLRLNIEDVKSQRVGESITKFRVAR